MKTPNFKWFAATQTLKQYLRNPMTDSAPKVFQLENFVEKTTFERRSVNSYNSTKTDQINLTKHNFTLIKLSLISN